MISVIISTYKPSYLDAIKINITNTIGCLYEIITIENDRRFGICEAYNEGAKIAKYSFLCFIHEDVIIKTNNWGIALIDHFNQDDKIGLIGVAGSKYKSLAPGGWSNDKAEFDRGYIKQHDKNSTSVKLFKQITGDCEEVVCVDGVFLFTKKSIWANNKFDQNIFKDFHCYDLDFSFGILKNYKIIVSSRILLEHLSPGSYSAIWIDETIKLTNKWKSFLPLGIATRKEQITTEWKQKIWFLTLMVLYKKRFKVIINAYLNYGFFKFFSFRYSLSGMKTIFTKIYTLNNTH